EIPPSLANFTQLAVLDLSSNDFTSRIPFWVFNLTKLVYLDFSLNKLSGAISSSLSQLENLEYLDLFSNNLSGTVELDMLLRPKNLTALCVSLNKLSLLPPKNSNATIQKFMILGLASCNLSSFPNFLQNQDRLGSLDLAFNNIHGQIPQWFWKTSTQSLIFLDLSHNFLTGSSQTPVDLPWSSLEFLDISSNKLQGSLPIPQSPIFFYSISKNELTGEISPLICNLIFLEVLDLSENNLNGKIPKSEMAKTEDMGTLEIKFRGQNIFHIGVGTWGIWKHSKLDVKLRAIIFLFIVIGHKMSARKLDWLVNLFGIRKQKWQRQKIWGRCWFSDLSKQD
ncbi:receptor-like protein 6, partial [Quercus suber]